MVCDNSINPGRDEPVLVSSVKQININAGDSFGSLINIGDLQDYPVGSSSSPLIHYNFRYLPDKEPEYIQLIDQQRMDTSPDYTLKNLNISTGDLGLSEVVDNLSEIFNSDLSLSDQNMADSLT
ncbi:hypothetical protein HHI36_024216 [Cryptolaemus montrouzieri]|uniref:Uncharacterized protein n=1 Tax=Cryptolaemus montrouzieri TaxID=559131 RepID=A0ABD2NIJ7_9CUCU